MIKCKTAENYLCKKKQQQKTNKQKKQKKKKTKKKKKKKKHTKKKKKKHCVWPTNNRSYPLTGILPLYILLQTSNEINASAKVIERKPTSTQEMKQSKLPFLHVTLLNDLINVPTQHFQIISNSMGVMACNDFGFRTPDYTLYSGVNVCWSEHSDLSVV